MATGSPGTNGVWQYGEDDSEPTFSALLNKAASTTDTQLGLDRARLTTLEAKPLSGLVPVVPTSVVIATGSGSANALGLVTFTGATSVSLNNVFSSSYLRYLILFNLNTGSASATTNIRLRNSGTDNSANNYFTAAVAASQTGSVTGFASAATASWIVNAFSNSYGGQVFSEIVLNNIATTSRNTGTFLSMSNQNNVYSGISGGLSSEQLTAFDGFTVFPATGNFAGTVQVFGYND